MRPLEEANQWSCKRGNNKTNERIYFSKKEKAVENIFLR